MKEVTVSVVMPVYNSSLFLDESIQSILNQTFENFELLLTDDGSTDDSLEKIKQYSDSRIRLIVHEKNMGLIFTRNEAVKQAKGKYIAFLDSDDIAIPERLEKQVAFLEKNADFGMIGGWVKTIDEKGIITDNTFIYTAKPEEIPIILIFNNYFGTSSVMLRKSCLPENPFEKEFPVAEDYNLWIRIAENYKVGNLQEFLIHYRMHGGNISQVRKEKMIEMDYLQLSKQLLKFDTEFKNEEFAFLYLIGKTHLENEAQAFFKTDFLLADNCLNKIIKGNYRTKRYDKDLLFKFLNKYWFQLFTKISVFNWNLLHNSQRSVFFKNLSVIEQTKFIIKCFILFKKK